MDDDSVLGEDKSHLVFNQVERGQRAQNSHAEALFEQARTLFDIHRLYVAVTYGSNHPVVRKDGKAVEASFKNGDISLISPAFLAPQRVPSGFYCGTASPTSDADFDHFLRSIASRNDWATFSCTDFQSEGGRSFPILYLHVSRLAQTNVNAHVTKDKVRIWVQAGVHGSEPAGDQALLALLGKMDADQNWTASLLDKVDVFVFPRYNPDGAAHFQRTFLSGLDPNRDHIKLACEQTRDIKKLFSSFAPHIAVDMHEFSAAKIYGGKYQQASDGLYSTAKNLNIHSEIRRISEELFASNVKKDLELRRFRCEPYATGTTDNTGIVFAEAGSDANIGRNAAGLTQCISFLTESRGIGLADQEFQRRTAASLAMVQSIIQTAADNAEVVYNTVETSINEFMNSKDDIVITDSPSAHNKTLAMVNSSTGDIEQVPVRFLGTTPTTPGFTRSRPAAYLISRSWPDLVSRLMDSGIVVDLMPQGYKGIVEAYKITSVSFGNTHYEGIVPVTVQAELVPQEVNLEAGAYWISTKQKNAALAFVAIEPENIDSWVSCNIIAVGVGDKLPIYRVMT